MIYRLKTKTSNLVVKVLSIIFSISLLPINIGSEMVSAATVNPITSAVSGNSSAFFDNINIPELFGSVEKSMSYGPSSIDSSKSRQVILIKDAHCNYEAQHNIAKILEVLVRDYKVDLVAVEGAAGEVDLERFGKMENPAAKEKATDIYVKKGIVTGSEYLRITKYSELPFGIYGIEDGGLYVKNFVSFRNTMSNRKETQLFIDELAKITNMLKVKIYSKGLLEFDRKANEYNENKISLTDWVKYLEKQEARNKKQDRNFNLVLRAINLEERIDFKKVEKERAELIRECEKKLPKEDIQQLVQKSLLYKLGKISSLDYYAYLNKNITAIHYSLSTINLRKYIHLVKLQSKIDSDKLFKEIDTLENSIKSKLFLNNTERSLDVLSKNINILSKLFNLQLTREGLKYFKSHKSEFSTMSLLSLIKIQAPLNNIQVTTLFNDNSFLKKIDESIIPGDRFYEEALLRDKALVDNTLNKMEKEKKQTAVMITGGFHADGIKKLLQDKNISYMVITPKITKTQEDCSYLSLMMDERIKFPGAVSNGENLSVPEMLGPKSSPIPGLEGLRADLQANILDLIAKGAGKIKEGEIEKLGLTDEDKEIIRSVIKAGQITGTALTVLEFITGDTIGNFAFRIELGRLSDASIIIEQIDEQKKQLKFREEVLNKKVLNIRQFTHQGRIFIQIGSRVYERSKETEVIDISEILDDPILWMGNAQLIDFFGEDKVAKLPAKTPSLYIVEWTEALAEGFPSESDISREEVLLQNENAYEQLKSPELVDPFLKAHYSLILYFGEVVPYLYNGDQEIKLELLNAMSNLGEGKLNELIFAILGAKLCSVPHVVSPQFRLFYRIIQKLQKKTGAKKIKTIIRVEKGQTNASDILIGRISSMLSQVSDYEVENSDFYELIGKLKERTKQKFSCSYDEGSQTITFDFMDLSKEGRKGPQRMMNVFPPRGPPVNVARDNAVVDAVAQMARVGTADTVNGILRMLRRWHAKWSKSEVIQGMASNNQVEPELVSEGQEPKPLGDYLKEKKIGIVRGGFGLGGASKETETWVRDMFSKDDMFSDRVEMLAGNYEEGNVDFGEKVDVNRSSSLFVDGYSYKMLVAAIFSQGKLPMKYLLGAVFKMDEIMEKLKRGGENLAGVGDIDELEKKQDEYFRKMGVADILKKIRENTKGENLKYIFDNITELEKVLGISETDSINILQAVHDFCVYGVKRSFINWINEKGLDVILIGQVALPNENPVVYAGLIKAIEEINEAREKGNKVIAFIRQNYFRQWQDPRPGFHLHMPSRNDPVEIFVESETNAQIFEKLFGYKPSVVYEAVKFPPINETDRRATIQEQMAESPDLAKARAGFVKKIEASIRPGQEMPNFKGGVTERDIIILQPSRMDSNKRPDSTITLAKMIQDEENKKEKPRKVRIIFLGKYLGVEKEAEKPADVSNNELETYKTIVKSAETLGLINQVYFVGEVTQMEVLGAMTYAHIMSQPSDEETFGRTPMEAMSMGVPIIVSRNYVYPYFEDYQVFRPLFGGYSIFIFQQGEMGSDGRWQKGPEEPSASMVTRIGEILNNRDQMDSISRLNFYLARRSMMNLKNTENFMRLWSVIQLDEGRESIRFRDNVVSLRRAGDIYRPLEAAFHRNKIPIAVLELLSKERNIEKALLKDKVVEYHKKILKSIQEIIGTTIDSEGILSRIQKTLQDLIGKATEELTEATVVQVGVVAVKVEDNIGVLADMLGLKKEELQNFVNESLDDLAGALVKILKQDGDITEEEIKIVVEQADKVEDVFRRSNIKDTPETAQMKEKIAIFLAIKALEERQIPDFVGRLKEELSSMADKAGVSKDMVDGLVDDLYKYDFYDEYFALMLDGVRTLFNVNSGSDADKYLGLLENYVFIKSKFEVKDEKFVGDAAGMYNVMLAYRNSKNLRSNKQEQSAKELLSEMAGMIIAYKADTGKFLALFKDKRIRDTVEQGLNSLIRSKQLDAELKKNLPKNMPDGSTPEGRIKRALAGYQSVWEKISQAAGLEVNLQDDMPYIIEYDLTGEVSLSMVREKAEKGQLAIWYKTPEQKLILDNWLSDNKVTGKIDFITTYPKAEGKYKRAVSMLTNKTAQGMEVPKGHRIVKGTESGEDDIILMNHIAGIFGSVDELNESTLRDPFTKLYTAYYGSTKSKDEIDQLVDAVINSAKDGISIVISLPPMSQFVKAYYDVLKGSRELILQSA